MRRLLLLVLAAVALSPALGRADMPGAHPSYLHALTDLRQARAHLERRGGNGAMKWDEHTAIAEIDAAIHEIKEAAIDDGKNLEDHPPVDARLDWRGQLHKTLELLHKARHDVQGEEDNNFARGLRHRALEHIDAAIQFTEQGIANSR
jgi:hypothetical protein